MEKQRRREESSIQQPPPPWMIPLTPMKPISPIRPYTMDPIYQYTVEEQSHRKQVEERLLLFCCKVENFFNLGKWLVFKQVMMMYAEDSTWVVLITCLSVIC